MQYTISFYKPCSFITYRVEAEVECMAILWTLRDMVERGFFKTRHEAYKCKVISIPEITPKIITPWENPKYDPTASYHRLTQPDDRCKDVG